MPGITSIGEILFDVYDDEKKPGGAPFNFIYHIKKLTGKGNFISRIGNDEEGRKILKFFGDKNLPADFLQTDDKRPTGRAIANMDKNKIAHWVIEEGSAYDFIEMKNEIEELVKKTDCLYFGTLAQRNSVSGGTIQSLLNKEIKYFCDLNIRQKFYSKEIVELSLKAADVLKINEEELILLNDILLNKEYDVRTASLELKIKYNIDLFCVTCGEKGSYLFKDEESNFCKAPADEVKDTVGAGDAYAAILCIGYLNGWNLTKLNEAANKFAGEIVNTSGSLPEDDNFYIRFKNDFMI